MLFYASYRTNLSPLPMGLGDRSGQGYFGLVWLVVALPVYIVATVWLVLRKGVKPIRSHGPLLVALTNAFACIGTLLLVCTMYAILEPQPPPMVFLVFVCSL